MARQRNPFGILLRKEDDPSRELSRWWEFDLELIPSNFAEKFVGKCGQNTGSIARILLATTCSAMLHGAEDLIRVEDNLVAPFPLDVRDKTDTTAIFFVRGVVEALGSRESEKLYVTHSAIPTRKEKCRDQRPKGRRDREAGERFGALVGTSRGVRRATGDSFPLPWRELLGIPHPPDGDAYRRDS
jgi:hypothetical protein